jgi:hypothetical protein
MKEIALLRSQLEEQKQHAAQIEPSEVIFKILHFLPEGQKFVPKDQYPATMADFKHLSELKAA